jgi:UDP-N-acetylglucosamine 2-epimerase (non-hydrolysing)
MHILHVVGARPNFMKAAPVIAAIADRGHRQTLVHTGQHYDTAMSDVFFQQLRMPAPDINLSVGSGSHAVQTAEVMVRFEPVLVQGRPELVLLYGDVNSTMAAALVCAKQLVPFGHVEAGLRSFDPSMPEEVNRVVTDRLADQLFTPSDDADDNLMREGVPRRKIHRIGNVMIDTLVRLLPTAIARAEELDVPNGPFILVTLHRPSNVDQPETLERLMRSLLELSGRAPVIFPVHPRTRARIAGLALGNLPSGLRLLDPLGYVDFLALQTRAFLVITDSGGIQEETTFLGVPCLTVRENTERPITIECGTNLLVGQDFVRLFDEAVKILDGTTKPAAVPLLWDGHAADRLANVIDSGLPGAAVDGLPPPRRA